MQRTINICTELPGPISRKTFSNQAIKRYIAGFPVNETHLDIVLSEGDGPLVSDIDGNWFLDCSNTLNLPFGHATPKWDIDAPVVNSSNYLTPSRLALLTELISLFPWLDGFQFRSSGTESVEGALRYARTYGGDELNTFSFEGAYHGLTLAAQVLMGKSEPYGQIQILPFPEAHTLKSCIKLLESSVINGPTLVVLETIQGATLRKLPNEFLLSLKTIKDEYPDRFLIMCDDMLASIRVGRWCSLPEWLNPDIFVGGKSWSGGVPFSFFGVNSVVRNVGGDILGTSTYGGNPLSCQASVQCIREIKSKNILDRILIAESIITEEALPRWRKARRVESVSALGLLFGLTMCSEQVAEEVAIELLRRGVLCARIGALLRFAPALNIEDELLREGLSIISEVLSV